MIQQIFLNMNIPRILITVLTLISFSAQARMYQWNDPDTGTTQLSGKPPAWYRSNKDGPRVIVFDKGRIVDDTNIRVSDDDRESLRLEALIKVEKNREMARQKMLESEQIKSKLDKATEGENLVNESEVTEAPANESESTVAGSDEQPLPEGDLTEDRMRKLLSEWEKQLTEKAKEDAGRQYMNIRQGTDKAVQETGSDYIRLESKSSE